MHQIQQKNAFFNEGNTLTYAFRLKALTDLKNAILSYEKPLLEALYKDLHKHEFEAYATEIGYVLKSIKLAQKKLKQWMKPKKVKTPWFQLATTSYIEYMPLGHVLIIGPYNYPFQLVIEPLIGAIAAGNVVTIKPSEFTPHTEKVLTSIIQDAFDEAYISVITGGVEVTSELLDQRFDHIFFTGSTKVGQIVYEKAAKHLTPVTLELGGKSPVIVDETANLKVTARRILYGKLMNAGQTCVAPDYVYVHHSIEDKFLNTLKETYETMFKHDALGHIVSDGHIKRLSSLIDEDKVYIKGSVKDKSMSFYVMNNVTWDDAVMKEEIFGPILPVLSYDDIDDVIKHIQKGEKPLACYMFSEHKKNTQYVLSHIAFGSGAINDTIMQITNPNLPFGGVGKSGKGHYNGHYSFLTFSHQRAMINHKTSIDPPIAYPPYDDKKVKTIRKIFK
ncbi:MAG: aldehyde dehydrogenase [Acholeplasmataceae bacterium]